MTRGKNALSALTTSTTQESVSRERKTFGREESLLLNSRRSQAQKGGGEGEGTNHSQKPSTGHQASEILDRDHHEGGKTKTEHHEGQDATRTVFFPGDSQKWCREDVGNEEYREDQIVLVPF